MAQGDVIADISDLATHSFYAVQPGAGESYIIDDFFAAGDTVSSGYGEYYDGTDDGSNFSTDTNDNDYNSYRVAQSKTHQETMFHINNTLYFRVYNESASTRKCGILAMQVQ